MYRGRQQKLTAFRLDSLATQKCFAALFACQQFEDASPAEVGIPFRGGGAWFEPDADLQWLGGDVAERVAACVAATGATDVVYAYPTQ